MTRISGCDGRYLSLAHQRRAWEELNAIFGEKTPDPPGPDPGPDPPVVEGNVVYYYPDEPVKALIIGEGIGARVNSFIIPVNGGLDVPRPFICLSGKKEIVTLWTYVLESDNPIEYMQVNFGFVQADGEYLCVNRHERKDAEGWPKEFMMCETFYDDGEGHVYYQCNIDPNLFPGPVAPYDYIEKFNYPTDVDVRGPAVSFYGMNTMRVNGAVADFGGTISASFYSSS